VATGGGPSAGAGSPAPAGGGFAGALAGRVVWYRIRASN